jgi:hypothetical protein
MRKILRCAAITSLVLATVVLGVGAAGAAQTDGHHRPNTCTGTFTAPGVLAGKYRGNVVVYGVCVVNAGAAVVKGDLILAPGSFLNATFSSGTASLTVKGNVKVGPGALLAMGCEANETPCTDNPNGTGQNTVFGNITAFRAVGVLVHASTIKRSVSVFGGGGGASCNPPFPGAFADIKSPPFTDAEDNSIGGNLTITGLHSCWLGALRNSVRGSVFVAGNTMADPDAMEVLANRIHGSIACFNNSPAVQYGDSGSSPNLVKRHAFGECGFHVLKPNPAPTPTTPGGPLEHISVKI